MIRLFFPSTSFKLHVSIWLIKFPVPTELLTAALRFTGGPLLGGWGGKVDQQVRQVSISSAGKLREEIVNSRCINKVQRNINGAWLS